MVVASVGDLIGARADHVVIINPKGFEDSQML